MGLLRYITAGAMGFAVAILYRLLAMTWRVERVGMPPTKSALCLFWHGEMLALASQRRWLRQARPMVLISRSFDGAVATVAARVLGLRVVRGSSSRGAVAGGLALLRAMRKGGVGVLAADGPRGPRRELGADPARLASLGGASIVVAAATVSRGYRLRSWDRLIIPLPFARIRIAWHQKQDETDLGSAFGDAAREARLSGSGG